jgi:hypothetical protein
LPAVLAALPSQVCKKDCKPNLQAYAEYALMYPFLLDKHKATLRQTVPGLASLDAEFATEREAAAQECRKYSGAQFELWFIRHSFSCNNNISKGNLVKFVASTKYDPGLTSQGIVDALLFDNRNLQLGGILSDGPLKVFVSTSMRTWETAALLYAKYRPVNLYVVPGLTEKHSSEMAYGNVPSPLPQQGAVMRVFIEQVYLQYGIALHSIVVYAYNNPRPLMTFYRPAHFPPVPQPDLERMSTRDEKRNKTDPVCSMDQCSVHELNPVRDVQVIPQTTWPRVFSEYYKEKPLFAALDRIMFTDLYNKRLDGTRVYLCTTHSRAMQGALTKQGNFSLLANPALRDFLNRDEVKAGIKQKFGVQCPLPVDETPQFVSSSHNMWQLKCMGTINQRRLCLTNVTMFQGFTKFTEGLGDFLDFNHSCENDVEGLSIVARKAVGLKAAHPTSRLYSATMLDPSKGQAEKARAELNRLERAWATRNNRHALRRTRRGG